MTTTKDLEEQIELLTQEILTIRTQIILTQTTVIKLQEEVNELKGLMVDIVNEIREKQ